jgi:hypothetical protein
MINVDREISNVLVNPLWEDIAWLSVMDYFLARDGDVTSEILDEHLAVTKKVTREDWDRIRFLRDAMTPAHRAQIVDALDAAPREGLVELLAFTCETSREFKAALRKAGAGKSLQRAIDYGMRRFVDEPAVRTVLWKRAKPYATTAARGKWNNEGEHAWRALYVTDTREGADAMKESIAGTWIYTNAPLKERFCWAAAKRVRLMTHGKRALPPLVVAMQESYTGEEITLSAAMLGGKAVLKHVEAKWKEYSRYGIDNNPARTALGGLLALAPRTKAYQDAANKVVPKLMKEDVIGWDDIGLVHGIVVGIEAGRVKTLHPLLEKIAKWKYKPPGYDAHGAERALLAAELVRRRARRTLDAG